MMIGYIFCIFLSFTAGFLMSAVLGSTDREDDPEIKMEIKAYRDILNGVKEQPTIEPEQKKGKWIPCSERLPIDVGHYLCSFEKPNRIDHIHVDLAYWTGGRWYGYGADAICAWMPLPEPYREESEKHEGSD